MGNTASSDAKPRPGGPAQNKDPTAEQRDHQKRHPRRRESVPALPNSARAAAAPPSASLESAHGQSSSASTVAQPTHSRGRSQTSAAPASKPMAREGTPAGLERSVSERQVPVNKEQETQPTPPMQVPTHPAPTDPAIQNTNFADELDPMDTTSPSYTAPSSQYGRPPRLPLPIEEEVLSQGSPLLSPADPSDSVVPDDEGAELPRRSSILSSATADDEEEAADDFQNVGRATGQMVDTLVEWKEGGDKVYVTGSFSGWEKKHRLHKNGPSRDPEALSAVIPLLVGAHHMTFLVDNQMRTSKFLPTAVDYTNVLINYIEVSPDDAHRAVEEAELKPAHDGQSKPDSPAAGLDQPADEASPLPQTLPPPTPDLRPTHQSGILSTGPSGIATPAGRPSVEERREQLSQDGSEPAEDQPRGPRRLFDDRQYHSDIPAFLVDMDAPEETHRFARANAVLTTQPAPPSLPMFLNKSILNFPTEPRKDDASILIMPNHTVLNHLTTTSIKQNVLATSATTRYKRKYVTTIFHKPTNESGE